MVNSEKAVQVILRLDFELTCDLIDRESFFGCNYRKVFGNVTVDTVLDQTVDTVHKRLIFVRNVHKHVLCSLLIDFVA